MRKNGRAAERRPARKAIVLLAFMAGLTGIAVLTVVSRHQRASPPGPATQISVVPQTNEADLEAPVPPPPPAPTNVAATSTDRSAVARELVKRLSEVEMQPGGVTPDSAAKWHQDLEALVEQGTVAVPPLREFFESKVNVRFDSNAGTNLLQEPTLRIAFIEVLFNIPTPDNVDLQEQLLRNTTDPEEVAVLARQLELQEPGKYRELILWAAQKSMQEVRNGQWPGYKTEGLVKLLIKYGGK